MKAAKTGIVYDPDTLLHKCHKKHYERPQRVINAIDNLKKKHILDDPHIHFIDKITPVDLKLIQQCHSEQYIKYVNTMWTPQLKNKQLFVLDTYFNQHTKRSSQIASGGVVMSIDKIMNNEWINGFAIVRPPGHHSGFRNVINGFCIYNNVAIGAKYLQNNYGLKKILIFDWDVHHGDGTQHIFKQDQNVLFISLHRYDRGLFYPGESGDVNNVGQGNAKGLQINIAWNTTNKKHVYYSTNPGDNEYIYAYERVLAPIIKQFQPQFILISAGFDSARSDPVGGFRLSSDTYHYLTTKLITICPKILAVLQGGYNLLAVANSVEAVIQALLKQNLTNPQNKFSMQQKKQLCWLPKYYHQNLKEIIDVISKYWQILKSQKLEKYEQQIKSNKERVYGIYEHESSSDSGGDEQSSSSVSDTQNVQNKQKQTSKEDNNTNVNSNSKEKEQMEISNKQMFQKQ